MASVSTIIDFLISRKFGSFAIIAKAFASLDKNENSENSKKVAEIEEFKNSLIALNHSDLVARYNFELTKEENERFYNQKNANADFVHWSKAAHWTIDEAIALSLGKDPSVVTFKEIDNLKGKTAFAKAFALRRDLALRAAQSRQINEMNTPQLFINWFNGIAIDIPKNLQDEVSKLTESNINWREEYLKLKNDYDQLAARFSTQQKPESTRKANNILEAFTAIAIDAYGYDPRAEKSSAPQDISDALDKIGAKGSPKTIRAWLREGAELLPSQNHKT